MTKNNRSESDKMAQLETDIWIFFLLKNFTFCQLADQFTSFFQLYLQ